MRLVDIGFSSEPEGIIKIQLIIDFQQIEIDGQYWH